LHAWTLAAAGRIGRVTAITIVVVNAASGGLLRIKSELGVRLAALDVAARTQEY